MAGMSVGAEDVAPLLDEIGNFADGRIAPAVSRPERPATAPELERLTAEALALGILPDAREPGFGLWEDTGHAHAMAFNIALLRRIGHANAGIAFAWHRLSLARWAERAMGWQPADTAGPLGLTLAPTGHYGLARTALARRLDGQAADAADEALLADWLDRATHATCVVAPAGWTELVWPAWRDGDVALVRVGRAQLRATPRFAQHGLDELCAFELTHDARAAAGSSGSGSGRVYARLLALEMIGLVAIGLGAVDHAMDLAAAYAATRRQGGDVIGRHPAVQGLVADIALARQAAGHALAAWERPLDAIGPGAAVACRARLYPALCRAASQAVQVFGGIGYMRDTGAEKILRDVNALRLQSGGTREPAAFAAAWLGKAA